jgi:hypothetical protein
MGGRHSTSDGSQVDGIGFRRRKLVRLKVKSEVADRQMKEMKPDEAR